MKTDRLLAIALVAALVVMAVLVVRPEAIGPGATGEETPAGRPRDVDMDLLMRRIIRGELSDREALYYRKE